MAEKKRCLNPISMATGKQVCCWHDCKNQTDAPDGMVKQICCGCIAARYVAFDDPGDGDIKAAL